MELSRYKNKILLGTVFSLIAITIVKMNIITRPFAFNMFHFALFVVYCIFYVILPGMAFLSILKFKQKGTLLNILTSFYFGLAYIIIQYYILTLLDLRILLSAISPLTMAILVIAKRKDHHFKFASLEFIRLSNIPIAVLILIVIISSALSTLFLHPSPSTLNSFTLNQDYNWHIGNVNILSGPNNIADFRVAGLTFTYHYFSDLLLTIPKIIFHIDAFSLVIQYQFILTGFLMASSFYLLIKLVVKNNLIAAILAAYALFYAFLDPLEGSYGIYYLIHWKTNVNAVAIALPCLIICVLHLKNIIENKLDGTKIVPIFVLLVLTLVLHGLKGPFGMVFIAATLIYISIAFILKRSNKSQIIFAVLALLGFSLIYFTLLNKGASLIKLNFSGTLTRSIFFKERLASFGNRWLAKLILTYLHFICVTGILGIPFTIGFIRNIVTVFRRDFQPFKLLCLFISAVGILSFYTFSHPGSSQLYFLMAATPFIMFIAGDCFVWLFNIVKSYFFTYKIKFAFSAGSIAIAIAVLFILPAKLTQTNKPIISQVNTVNPSSQVASNANINSKINLNCMTHNEYLGLIWLHDNTPNNSLCATNRHSIFPRSNDGRYFYYTAFSDRPFYVEGFAYASNSGLTPKQGIDMAKQNDKLFQSDCQDRYALAKSLKVKYLVISNLESLNDQPNESGFSPVYKNQDISIYKVIY